MSNTSNPGNTPGKTAPAANTPIKAAAPIDAGTDKILRQSTVVEPSKAGAAAPSDEPTAAISASPQIDQGTSAAQQPAKIDEPAKH